MRNAWCCRVYRRTKYVLLLRNRGGGRIIYEKQPNGAIEIVEIITGHNY